MGLELGQAPHATAHGNHFSCSMSAVLVARVHAHGGDAAVRELLRASDVKRTAEYLLDTGNWIAYDEAVRLWRAGAVVTHHPQFARMVGEDAARRLNGSPVAALLRSLGSPQNVFSQMATSATKFSTVSTLEAVDVGPGFAEIVAVGVDGFPRSAEHCAWTCGLLTQPPVLFGRKPAIVEHDECEAFGADRCRYWLTWDTEEDSSASDSTGEIVALRTQLDGMRERLESMFETAADLIAADDIEGVLARITERAAVEVRAPRYLLAVRFGPDGELHCHHKGFDQREVEQYARQILEQHPAALPESWLVVPVRSNRNDYGRLLAMSAAGRQFFPQERELLEVYARYAASALDNAAALLEAQERYALSSALLALARALAASGTSGEVVRRLTESTPLVVDCDRVAVYLWDAADDEIVECAANDGAAATSVARRATTPDGPFEQLLKQPNREPIFIDGQHGHPAVRELFASVGAVATILVPLATADSFLGFLAVSVLERPERLQSNPDLLDRLSGVAAQATTALQNGRLVDQITHQALHDELTGLANRLQFTDDLRAAIGRARQRSDAVTLFYIDLDGFKPVNDRFGHDIGDALLTAVGERLSACTRSGDSVARLGGDEFVVLIDARKTDQDAEALARRLADVFVEPFVVAGHRLQLGASIGRAAFPQDAGGAEELLRLADAAMFEHKRGLRDQAA